MTTDATQKTKLPHHKIALIAGALVLAVGLLWFFRGPTHNAIERDDHLFTIRGSQWPKDWKDMAKVLTHAKAEKIENPDGTQSFRITNIDTQGVFAALGIEEEDIIISINNRPIYDIQEVMSMLGSVSKDQTIELGLKRADQDEVLVYKIIQ
jgi:hypothetical protein